jgi:RNase P subunit RPR2
MKPYRHPNKRVQFRQSDGKFITPTIEADCCSKCRGIVIPDYDYSTGFRKRVWPKQCPQCGATFTYNKPEKGD